jgi:hypothetical protein
MMIEPYRRYDGQALGADKVGEGSGENEGKIGDFPESPKTHHKNAYAPKPNPLRNRLDTTPAPPVFPPHTNNFQKPIKFKSDLGNKFFGKKERNRGRRSQSPKPKPKPKSFHYEHCGRDGHLAELAFSGGVMRGWLERWPTRTGTALLVVCLSLGWCRGARVWCVLFTLGRGVSCASR